MWGYVGGSVWRNCGGNEKRKERRLMKSAQYVERMYKRITPNNPNENNKYNE